MKLLIPQDIRQQLFGYVLETAPYEITGIGTIKTNRIEGNFTVTEIFLPQQKTSVSHCEFTNNGLHEIIFDLIKDNPTEVGNLRFRWHSHGHGKVFWSSTDEQDISENSDCDWVVNLVINSQQHMLARLDLFQPFRIANIPLEVVSIETPPPSLIEKCRAEIAKKVSRLPSNHETLGNPNKKGGEV